MPTADRRDAQLLLDATDASGRCHDKAVDGIELIGFVPHGGVVAGHSDTVDTGPRFDVQISHEAELTDSGRFLIVSDERGGAVLPPEAACDPFGLNAETGNGGLHAFRVDRLLTERPDLEGDDLAITVREQTYTRTPEGAPAIAVPPARVPAPATCTAHVFHQIPGQSRIFMGSYRRLRPGRLRASAVPRC